jgi:hypothetical protein
MDKVKRTQEEEEEEEKEEKERYAENKFYVSEWEVRAAKMKLKEDDTSMKWRCTRHKQKPIIQC